MEYTGKQKAYLKGLANEMEVLVKIGDKGITENLKKSLEELLVKRELVKVSNTNPDREERAKAAEELAAGTNSVLVNIIGKTMLYYRENPDNPVVSKGFNKVK